MDNNLNTVYCIFKDFFGEELVDLQDHTIIVFFPHVRVTNENDRYIDITKLFVKVVVNNNGLLEGTFTMNRSEYTSVQVMSDYAHSHLPGISSSYDFATPCLGNGPIVSTCSSLNRDFDEDLWRLFCVELAKFVTVESLNGGPYRRLEQVGKSFKSNIPVSIYPCENNFEGLSKEIMDEFLIYVIDNFPFTINYINGVYSIADGTYEIIIKISNLFIEWYNSLPEERQDKIEVSTYIYEIYAKNHQLLKPSGYTYRDYQSSKGKPICTFKGKVYKLNIIEDIDNNEDNLVSILNTTFINAIISRILKFINYTYARNSKNRSKTKTFFTTFNTEVRIL